MQMRTQFTNAKVFVNYVLIWVKLQNQTERIRFNGQATKGLCTDDLVR